MHSSVEAWKTSAKEIGQDFVLSRLLSNLMSRRWGSAALLTMRADGGAQDFGISAVVRCGSSCISRRSAPRKAEIRPSFRVARNLRAMADPLRSNSSHGSRSISRSTASARTEQVAERGTPSIKLIWPNTAPAVNVARSCCCPCALMLTSTAPSTITKQVPPGLPSVKITVSFVRFHLRIKHNKSLTSSRENLLNKSNALSNSGSMLLLGRLSPAGPRIRALGVVAAMGVAWCRVSASESSRLTLSICWQREDATRHRPVRSVRNKGSLLSNRRGEKISSGSQSGTTFVIAISAAACPAAVV